MPFGITVGLGGIRADAVADDPVAVAGVVELYASSATADDVARASHRAADRVVVRAADDLDARSVAESRCARRFVPM